MKSLAAHIQAQADALKKLSKAETKTITDFLKEARGHQELESLRSEWGRDPSEFGYYEQGDYPY